MSLDVWIYRGLTRAASSVAEPASRAAAATYESANGQMTVTSQVSGFPASQGTGERPSGRYSSDRLRLSGSLVHGMPAETRARATQSFRALCLAGLAGAFLQTKQCSPCASTRAPQWDLCGTHRVKPSRIPTPILTASSSSLNPHVNKV